MGGDAFFAEDDRAVVVFAVADAAEGADAVILPCAGDQFAAFLFAAAGLHARDAFAAGSHQGVKKFAAMDAVPVEVGVLGEDRAGSPSVDSDDFADFGIVFECGQLRAKAQGGTAEPGDVIFFGEVGDGDGVGE